MINLFGFNQSFHMALSLTCIAVKFLYKQLKLTVFKITLP